MIDKILKIIILTTLLSACTHQLPREVVLKFKDKNALINVIISESNRSHSVYFGVIKIANLSNAEIKLPEWENKIFLSNRDGVFYPVFLDYGYIGNKIVSDFITSVKSNEFFEHKIFIKVGSGFEVVSSQVTIGQNLVSSIVQSVDVDCSLSKKILDLDSVRLDAVEKNFKF